MAEPVRLLTADGLELPGLLWLPELRRSDWPVDAAVCVHGSTSHMSSEPLLSVARHLARRGLPALTFSNRGREVLWTPGDGRFLGYGREDLSECTLDIDAAMGLVRSLGAGRIALIGHSLGGIKAAYYAADGEGAGLGAVVLVSASRFARSFFEASRWREDYQRALEAALQRSPSAAPRRWPSSTFPVRC